MEIGYLGLGFSMGIGYLGLGFSMGIGYLGLGHFCSDFVIHHFPFVHYEFAWIFLT